MEPLCTCDSTSLSRNKRFDADFCETCDQWVRGVCSDDECIYCARRPAKPSMADNTEPSMTPIYIPRFVDADAMGVEQLISETPWLDRTETRGECFMSEGGGISYTYGQGRGVRTYTSIDYTFPVKIILSHVNGLMDRYGWGHMNGCFLNLYRSDRQHLGWHADDFRKMDHDCPVVVVSFGETREIWWRKKGERGMVPEEDKRWLEPGSVFIMPPGMQFTHEHRIPKGSRSMGPRISMTFRRFL